MEKEAKIEQKPGGKPRKKRWKIVIGILALLVVALVAAVVIAVPAYVSSESGRQFILNKVNAAGAGRADFADLSMGWMKGISVSGISFIDEHQGVAVAVKEFSTRPNYGALLTGSLSFGETVIDRPRVEIDVEKLKQKAAAASKAEGKGTAKSEPAKGIPIERIDLVVKDGGVKIRSPDGAVEVSQINSNVNLRGAGEQSKFDLTANVAGAGTESTISARGTVEPGKGWTMEGANGDLTVEVNNLDLGSLESILAVAGVEIGAKGVVSANLASEIKNGAVETIVGDVKGSGLEITTAALKGDTIKSSMLDAEVQAHRSGDLMSVEKLALQTDWLKATASGEAPVSASSISEFMKPDSKYELKANMECDIPAVAAQLPNTLGLKKQTKVTGGKLVASVQTLTEAGEKKLLGQVRIEGLSGMVEGKPISLSEPIRAEAKIGGQGKEVKFDRVGITSSFAKVDCAGTMEAINYDAQIDLAKLAAELGQFADLGKYKLAGQLASKGQISNNEKTTTIDGSVNIANLKASPTADVTITEPKASVEVSAAIDKANKILSIKQLKADTSFGQFGVTDGKVPIGEGAKGTTSLKATARGVDLSKLQPYLVMAKAISKDVQLGGVAESDLMLGFAEGSYRITTDSTKITNLLLKSPGKAAFIRDKVELMLDAEVNPTQRTYRVRSAELVSPDINVKVQFDKSVKGDTSSLQGKAELDYDWKAIGGMLSAFMPSELVIEGRRKDEVSFSSRYPADEPNAMLANLDAQAKVGFDKAGYMGLNLGATQVDIKIQKGLLSLAPFTTSANNGKLSFGGRGNFNEAPAFFTTPGPMKVVENVEINDEIANKLLAAVNPVFSGAVDVSGVADFQCEKLSVPIKGGGRKDIEIVGTVSLTKLNMRPTGLLGVILSATGASRGETFTILPTKFVVRNGYVSYENMELDIGNNPVNFSGVLPLDPDKEIKEFKITLPYTSAGRTVRVGQEGEQRRITAYIKGTPRKPELDLGKVIQEQLIDTGLDLLFEQIQKK